MIKQLVRRLLNSNEYDDPYVLPKRDYNIALKNPYFRDSLRDLSLGEDDINSYYTSLLHIVANSCVGPLPIVLGTTPNDELNDSVEDRWKEWAVKLGIGAALRECRRDACKTGLGIMIPYNRENVDYEHTLAFRNVCVTKLQNPMNYDPAQRIINGIEYDKNDDIIAIYIANDTGDSDRYEVPTQAIVWKKPQSKYIVPECGPAFCLFPSVRRVMDSIVRAEELNQSIPMAVELDPLVYKPEDAEAHPGGAYEYEPGMIPTLPPGATLKGLNIRPQGEERVRFIELVISAASRCKLIPKNVILGDSSGHNMATAQVDIEPWKNEVDIDRVDFEPVTRQVFSLWYRGAVNIKGYISKSPLPFTFDLTYKNLFSHPDPGKKATARLTDLISGATTLYRIYTEEGRNPRRELAKDRALFNLTDEQQAHIIMTGRTKDALQVLTGLDANQNQGQDNNGKDSKR